MEQVLEKASDFGALGLVLAFLLWFGATKIFPVWKETVKVLGQAIEALNEHLEYMRKKNGKKT